MKWVSVSPDLYLYILMAVYTVSEVIGYLSSSSNAFNLIRRCNSSGISSVFSIFTFGLVLSEKSLFTKVRLVLASEVAEISKVRT